MAPEFRNIDGGAGYLEGVTAETFEPAEYLRRLPAAVLLDPQRGRERRRLTKRDPLLFALLYCRHLLRSRETGDEITFADFHLDLCRDALERYGRRGTVDDGKYAYIAPRGMGKSTWCFVILPLWALAHRHREYMIAVGEQADVARKHMLTLRRELEQNENLRRDFPKLCNPAKQGRRNEDGSANEGAGRAISESSRLYVSVDQKVIQASGIDSTNLGAAFGGKRPDLIVFDDIEPDEGNYSTAQKERRLSTVIGQYFPMSPSATVTFVGTVQMAGAIMHDVLRYATEPNADDLEPWVKEARIEPRYYPLLATSADGEARSTWEAKYPTAWCRERAGTSEFRLAYMNEPRGRDGGFWVDDDFVYEQPDETFTRWVLEVDPAVTTKVSSDWTGLAVVAATPPGKLQRACVVDAWQVKLMGSKLRDKVLAVLGQYPRIRAVRVEVNQGGEMWQEALAGLPVKLLVHTSTAPKDARMAWALDHYQRRRVTHAQKLRVCEEEMLSYPRGANDDVADAAASGILFFLARPPALVAGRQGSRAYAS